ncbi:uncharacterized protein Z520_11450 [Fonsecaea multimorphosa CBS 102226]|uniref:Uncharacterized protein n=1 Tax=Fonsecaea multimorphosa CBS 102226 TaxID=1442371 RepID=A0A0D2JHX5_9EURO|nr:uncharacterized protein Z520_11450 [Fonsecaea multimorphosa CBS 102226]KIX92787.1 hypothetical protein Z520_11450 [Fonsecaea multimorphosa CBS 102226]OAL18035.1 hypothetical protein AYO22_11051 [Fonsecaea multimorphosa]
MVLQCASCRRRAPPGSIDCPFCIPPTRGMHTQGQYDEYTQQHQLSFHEQQRSHPAPRQPPPPCASPFGAPRPLRPYPPPSVGTSRQASQQHQAYYPPQQPAHDFRQHFGPQEYRQSHYGEYQEEYNQEKYGQGHYGEYQEEYDQEEYGQDYYGEYQEEYDQEEYDRGPYNHGLYQNSDSYDMQNSQSYAPPGGSHGPASSYFQSSRGTSLRGNGNRGRGSSSGRGRGGRSRHPRDNGASVQQEFRHLETYVEGMVARAVSQLSVAVSSLQRVQPGLPATTPSQPGPTVPPATSSSVPALGQEQGAPGQPQAPGPVLPPPPNPSHNVGGWGKAGDPPLPPSTAPQMGIHPQSSHASSQGAHPNRPRTPLPESDLLLKVDRGKARFKPFGTAICSRWKGPHPAKIHEVAQNMIQVFRPKGDASIKEKCGNCENPGHLMEDCGWGEWNDHPWNPPLPAGYEQYSRPYPPTFHLQPYPRTHYFPSRFGPEGYALPLPPALRSGLVGLVHVRKGQLYGIEELEARATNAKPPVHDPKKHKPWYGFRPDGKPK